MKIIQRKRDICNHFLATKIANEIKQINAVTNQTADVTPNNVIHPAAAIGTMNFGKLLLVLKTP